MEFAPAQVSAYYNANEPQENWWEMNYGQANSKIRYGSKCNLWRILPSRPHNRDVNYSTLQIILELKAQSTNSHKEEIHTHRDIVQLGSKYSYLRELKRLSQSPWELAIGVEAEGQKEIWELIVKLPSEWQPYALVYSAEISRNFASNVSEK